MDVQPAAFLRTTLPLDLGGLEEIDSGRYHSVWLPDHLVSFWPDSIWTPEFTDLAVTSPSPHRYLDSLAVAGAVAVSTQRVGIATSVVDTVRRHPVSLAQSALTLDHLSRGRFILGLGSGELENTVPYGFEFDRPVARFAEALAVIRLLWEHEGPVDFDGEFFRLRRARLDTEPFGGRCPPIWIGANGPRMLELAGRYADGWWPADIWSPDDYAEKLTTLRAAAERAGRDPDAITPALIITCFVGDDDELAEVVEAPLVKAYVMQIPATVMRAHGHEHPLGDDWRGFHDIDPSSMTRERVLDMLARTDPQAILDVVPHGSPQRDRPPPGRVLRRRAAGAEDPRLLRDGGRRVRDALGLPGAGGGGRVAATPGGAPVTRVLDADELLADAQAATGCAEWGDPTFPDRFRVAVDVIRAALVGPGGEGAAAVNCSWLLTDRLRFMADHERLDLGAEPVEHPLFVTGAPRSGTTLLHALLSVDPAARALRFWEVMHPSPPPGPAPPTIPAGRSPTPSGARSTRSCRPGSCAIRTTTCSATACPSASARGRSTSGC